MVLFTSSIKKIKGAAYRNCDVDGTCKPALITVRKRSFGKVMFSQACVKNSVHRGVRGRCTYPLPPARQMPPGQTPPLGRHPPPWADVYPSVRRPLQRTVRILLECILVLHCMRARAHPKSKNRGFKGSWK